MFPSYFKIEIWAMRDQLVTLGSKGLTASAIIKARAFFNSVLKSSATENCEGGLDCKYICDAVSLSDATAMTLILRPFKLFFSEPINIYSAYFKIDHLLVNKLHEYINHGIDLLFAGGKTSANNVPVSPWST